MSTIGELGWHVCGTLRFGALDANYRQLGRWWSQASPGLPGQLRFRFRLTVAASTRILVVVELIKLQRNEIFAAVVAGGLDPVECDLTSDTDGSKVSHIPSGSYLSFSYGSGVYSGSGWIPDGPPVGFQSPEWSFVPNRVKYWAEQVKQTLELPDLWAELHRGKEFLGEVQDASSANTPFTPAEQVSINQQLREIKEYVRRTCSFSDEQLSLIEARFDQAEEAARHLGRKDWLLLFSGVIFTLIVTDLLPPAVAQHILMMALHGLEHLFAHQIQRPQIRPAP